MSVRSLNAAAGADLNLRDDIRRASASAYYQAYSTGTNVSLYTVLREHYVPRSGTSDASIGGLQSAPPVSYRCLKIVHDATVTNIGVSYPLVVELPARDSTGSVANTAETTLYLKAISYDDYSYVTLTATLAYGYTSYRWENGGFYGTLLSTSSTVTLYVSTFTSLSGDTLAIRGV